MGLILGVIQEDYASKSGQSIFAILPLLPSNIKELLLEYFTSMPLQPKIRPGYFYNMSVYGTALNSKPVCKTANLYEDYYYGLRNYRTFPM